MNLRDKVLQLFNQGEVHFKSFSALFSIISKFTGASINDATKCINKLLKEGIIIEKNRHTLTLAKNLGVFVGTLIGNARGFGFIRLENSKSREEDYFVPAKNMNGALDGDTVQFKVIPPDTANIVKILKRGNTSLVGQVVEIKKGRKQAAYIQANNTKFSKLILVTKKDLNNAQLGDTVMVDITYQPENNSENPCGRVISVLQGNEVENAIETVLAEKQIPKNFRRETIEESETLKVNLETEKSKRVDLTNKVIFTIDGADAKDLDDAISLEKNSKGFVLGVHIADVGNFVVKDSKLDEEAYYRATSVYFPTTVYPMLPKRLSNDLCSLNADEPKLAMSVEMQLDFDGNVLSYKIFESIIKSTQRLTYAQVFSTLNGTESGVKPEIVPVLKDMINVSAIISKKRISAGALDFDIPECQFEFDETGAVINVKKRDRNNAHKLIENFMVLCNEVVAECFFKLELPFVYRVHEFPIKTKFDEIVTIINGLGAKLKFAKKITPKFVQNIISEIKDESYAEIANKLVLRAMEKAVYAPECKGHFGLALDYYAHFTSPIRRYPDLTIHRIIKEVLNGLPNRTIKSEELAKIKNKIKLNNLYDLEEFVIDSSFRSSERERIADEAERDVDDIYKAQLMKNHVGEIFEGKISGVTKFGLFVELENTVEGLIKIESLPEDNYDFDEKKMILAGRKHKFNIGDNVQVKLINASVTQKRIDFSFIKFVGDKLW